MNQPPQPIAASTGNSFSLGALFVIVSGAAVFIAISAPLVRAGSDMSIVDFVPFLVTISIMQFLTCVAWALSHRPIRTGIVYAVGFGGFASLASLVLCASALSETSLTLVSTVFGSIALPALGYAYQIVSDTDPSSNPKAMQALVQRTGRESGDPESSDRESHPTSIPLANRSPDAE